MPAPQCWGMFEPSTDGLPVLAKPTGEPPLLALATDDCDPGTLEPAHTPVTTTEAITPPGPVAVSVLVPQFAMITFSVKLVFDWTIAVPTAIPLSFTVTVEPAWNPPAVTTTACPAPTTLALTVAGGVVGPG
jgi:hypothetical protein